MNSIKSNRKNLILVGLSLVCISTLSFLLWSNLIYTNAAIYTVVTNADSGPGSLRQAIIDANANPGIDTISFNLPSAQTIIQPITPLNQITGDVVIEGNTQPGYIGTPIVAIDGINVGNASGLNSIASQIEINGLAIYNFQRDGISINNAQNVIVEGIYSGILPDGITAAANGYGSSGGYGIDIGNSDSIRVGGLTEATRNIISSNGFGGLSVSGSTNATIQNNYIGTDVSGSLAMPNDGNGIELYDVTDINIGTVSNSGGNLISGNNYSGVSALESSDINIVNNTIGLDKNKTSKIPNNNDGIYINSGVSDFQIGGVSANESNTISGNNENGVYTNCGTTQNGKIINNFIGTNSSGTANLGNSASGVTVYSAQNIQVGGTGNQEGNIIAFNEKHGVSLEVGAGCSDDIPLNNPILGNSIYENVLLGINHENIAENINFIDPNDIGDTDAGPNNLQNSPTITARTISGSNINVSGTLNSTPNTTFRIELFSVDDSVDTVTDREGRNLLGYVESIITDSTGNASWVISAPLSIASQNLTTTATSYTTSVPNVYENTSEFGVIDTNKLNPTSSNLLSFTTSEASVVSGSNIPYTIIYTNNGDTELTNVVVNVVLDSNLEFVSCTGGCVQNGNTLTWNIGTVNAGDSDTLTFVAKTSIGFGGTVRTVASLFASEILDPKTESISTNVINTNIVNNTTSQLVRTGGK
jgi:hypothetical protein